MCHTIPIFKRLNFNDYANCSFSLSLSLSPISLSNDVCVCVRFVFIGCLVDVCLLIEYFVRNSYIFSETEKQSRVQTSNYTTVKWEQKQEQIEEEKTTTIQQQTKRKTIFKIITRFLRCSLNLSISVCPHTVEFSL